MPVDNTPTMALKASGCDQARVVHKPRLLSDNGSYTSPANWPTGSGPGAWIMFGVHRFIPRPRARSSVGTRPSRTASCSRTTSCRAISNGTRSLRRPLQQPPLPREPRQSVPGRRLLRPRSGHHRKEKAHQGNDHTEPPVAPPKPGGITSTPDEPNPPIPGKLIRPIRSDDGHPLAVTPIRA